MERSRRTARGDRQDQRAPRQGEGVGFIFAGASGADPGGIRGAGTAPALGFYSGFYSFLPPPSWGGGFGAPEGVVSVGYQCWSVVGNRGCGCHSVAEIRLGVLIKVVGMRQGDKVTGKALSALKNPPPQLTPCPRPHSPTQTSCWHNDFCVWLVLGVCGGGCYNTLSSDAVAECFLLFLLLLLPHHGLSGPALHARP